MDLNSIYENKNLSPMMKQYIEIKQKYNDCYIFYRVGDFYEMFFDDALNASKELEIALTSKDCGLDEKAPMCGVPYHAADSYITRLVNLGYKVAVAEQVENPKEVKGIVKREIIKIVTPGTLISEDALKYDKNNYIFSVYYDLNGYGIAIVDFSTGDFYVTEVSKTKNLIDTIDRFRPSEILFNNYILMADIDIEDLKSRFGFFTNICDNEFYDVKEDDYLKKLLKTVTAIDLKKENNILNAIYSIYVYLKQTQKTDILQFEKIIYFASSENMYIDNWTIRNLELIESIRDKEKYGTLLYVIDKTKTAMGKRLIKKWIIEPLNNVEEILYRQNAVEELMENEVEVVEISRFLNEVYDLERILTRVTMKVANPLELISFKKSIAVLPHIKNILKSFKSKFLVDVYNEFDELKDLCDLIENSIKEDAPLTTREGNIIKDGFNKDIDTLRDSKTKGKEWLIELEEREREKTNIKNLKIKHSRVFGFLFEITNSFKGEVPDYFIRKQTLTTAERYTTKELEELQSIILNADEKLSKVEYDIYMSILFEIIKNVGRIKKVANIIATIDVIISFAIVSKKNNYVKPIINKDSVIDIKSGRHPVVEVISKEVFVPNDTTLDDEKYIDIITGPNMAGKSTYMRQVALIVLMAHIGIFVPAEKANICLVDRIFTRVGASDDLSKGQSTFLVEMNEVANIIDNATEKSLIILDEIGRGTSTYDGLSIAWAIVEYISEHIKAKTLFATHYHELSELEGKVLGVSNYNIAVNEQNDEIIFLRKILKGSAKKSYGIAVAKLAGVNNKIIKRANTVLKELVKNDLSQDEKSMIFDSIDKDIDNEEGDNLKMEYDRYKYLYDKIKNIDITNVTPMNALMLLSNIKEEM